MRLREWQDALVNSVIEKHPDEKFREWLARRGGAERLDVYRDSVHTVLIRALQKTYPICAMVVGEVCFRQFAQRYALENPPIGADLNLYGASFGQFVGSEIAVQESLAPYAYLAALAELEWMLQRCFYSANDKAMDTKSLGRLANVPLESERKIGFVPRPTVSLLRSEYPVHLLWQRYCQRERGESLPTAGNLHAEESHYFYVIHRPKYKPTVAQIRETDHALLSMLIDGCTLGDVTDTEGPDLVIDCLPRMIGLGLFADFYLRTASEQTYA